MSSETLITQDFSRQDQPAVEEHVSALVVLWFIDEPERVGEVVLVPRETRGMLGRGERGMGGGETRLRLARQRPGRTRGTGPIRSPRISRDQLLLEVDDRGAVHVDNVGRARMSVNGARAPSADLSPGDVIELRNRMLLLVTTRPMRLPEIGAGLSVPLHGFGLPDEHGIVGETPVMWKLRERLAFIAGRSPHVLVKGASGTGKELAANAIHSRSERGRRPIISRNAATFPETLIDAELFGNVRDFPNPGMRDRPGLVGEADGSSLFLDEIGELPAELQAHLLRVLDDGEYQRLGESRTRRSDFRLIGATNRPEVQIKHDFRARLEMRVDLPALNARREDIPLLARHLLRRIARDDREIAHRFFVDGDPTGEPRIGPALMSVLVRHSYTTHVRELLAMLWQSMSSSSGRYLDNPAELVPWLQGGRDSEPEPEPEPEPQTIDPAELSPEQIQTALDRHNGVQERVWRELGLKNRYQLYRLIKKYGLHVGRDPSLPGGE